MPFKVFVGITIRALHVLVFGDETEGLAGSYAADVIQDGPGVRGHGRTAPSDVVIGSDQHEVAFIECTRMLVANVDDRQY